VSSNLLITAKRMFARRLRAVVGEYMGEDGEVEQEIADLRAILGRGRDRVVLFAAKARRNTEEPQRTQRARRERRN